jgi:hypothetical protein
MRANYGQPLRKWMKGHCIEEITDFGDLPVFEKATTYPCILVITNQKPKKTLYATKVGTLDFPDLSKYVRKNHYIVNQSSLNESGWSLSDEQTENLLKKINTTGVPLEKYVDGKIFYGIKTGLNEAFIIDSETRDRLVKEDSKSSELMKPFVDGKDIKRYIITSRDKFLIFIPKGWTNEKSGKTKDAWSWLSSQYPAVSKQLHEFKEKAERRTDKGEYWWELRACDYYAEFEKPKIIFPEVSITCGFTIDPNKFYPNKTCSVIDSADEFLLGVLNSKVSMFFMKSVSSMMRGGYYMFSAIYVGQIPIPATQEAEKSKVRSLVTQMLDLNKRLSQVRTPDEKTMLSRQIEATDKLIDALVYQLYGLSEEEIKIVEGT